MGILRTITKGGHVTKATAEKISGAFGKKLSDTMV